MICPTCGTSNTDDMRFCGMCGSPLKKQQVIGRERRRVSVVFIDLASFSTLTHGFDPEDLRDLADEVLTVVAGIIEDYDGYVDAFRGDGLIALFGAPHSHPDDPKRAVSAAAAGLRAIESIGTSKGYPLRGRAGVNTGIVIAGSVGSGRVRDYTVMGSAVSFAARLEEAAQPGEVWVGPETYEATRHQLLYDPISPVSLAGFPNIAEVYRLVATLEEHQADPFAHLAFVGRKRELAALHGSYRSVVDEGRPREVWLLGEVGSGKTRLLREFVATLQQKGIQVWWIEGQPTESYSWFPLGRQIFGLHEGADPRLQKQRVSAVLEEVMPDEPRWQRLILASLDLLELRPWTRLERRSVDRTNVAWRDFLTRLIRRPGGPEAALLIVENNPNDARLQEFLGLLQEAQAPILVIRTSRGREQPPGQAIITLEPLDLDESLELLNQLASPILKVATQSLVYQVGGIPAYILELGRALGITQRGSFSGSLASLLQARLDMLEPRARQLLAHGSLAGERCWEGLLRSLVDHGDGSEIQLLTREQLLIKEPSSAIPGEVEYRFQSELLRQAVLRMIPFGDRPLLHLKIANWLEQHAPLSLSGLIGFHFSAGGSDEAAYPHYLAAADQAIMHQDYDEAKKLFERVLGLEVTPDLLAQGALTYAQAALSAEDKVQAETQLERAKDWIGACEASLQDDLRRIYKQLCEDVRNLPPP